MFFNTHKHIGFIKPDGETKREKNLLCHISAFNDGYVPRNGAKVTYSRGLFNQQPVARRVGKG